MKFPSCSPNSGSLGPYVKISDAKQGDHSELPDSQTLDIENFGPYVNISDVKQGDLSDLSGI